MQQTNSYLFIRSFLWSHRLEYRRFWSGFTLVNLTQHKYNSPIASFTFIYLLLLLLLLLLLSSFAHTKFEDLFAVYVIPRSFCFWYMEPE